MSFIIKSLLRHVPLGPLHRFRKGLNSPLRCQESVLRKCLTAAQHTEFGSRYRFAEILQAPNLIKAYQQNVPLHNFQSMQADIDRACHGAADLTWPGAFKYFTRSSGTTSHGKVFPVSPGLLQANIDLGVAMIMNYVAETGDIKAVQGKVLTLCGCVEPFPQVTGGKVGELSALISEHYYQKHEGRGKKAAPWQAIPRSFQLITGMEERLAAIVEHTMTADIRMIIGLPPWLLILFRRVVARYNEKFNRQAKSIGEIWPNLRLLVCGGVPLQTYRGMLEEAIGLPHLNFLEAYGATEACVAFQNELEDPAMALHANCGIFFEFVPLDEMGSDNPQRLTVDQIEPDVRYVPHLTNSSGLWSFCGHDVLRFTSTKPPKLLVCGRTSEMLQDFSEYVIGEEVQAVLASVGARTGAHVAEYHVCARPVSARGPHTHTWILEFERMPRDLTQFLQLVDENLQEQNSCYETCRKKRGFGFPEAFCLPSGTFHRYLKETRGYLDAQTKIPRLRDTRDFAEGVLRFAGRDHEFPDAAMLDGVTS